MSDAQWEALCDRIADQMKVHTRPFVTPLVEDVIGRKPHIGTGTYLDRDGIELLTCEHVACHDPFHHQFYGHEPLLFLPVNWRVDPYPVDAAIAAVPRTHWASVSHKAKPFGMGRFAARHQPVEHEIFFFRGIAGENVSVGAYHSSMILSGYCSQEKPGIAASDIFEILWHPAGTTITRGTSPDIAKQVKYDDPAGFSGSLVWNTRFVEKGCDLSTWTPEDAQATGLLRRWDTSTKTLLVWRVEHLLAWLKACPPEKAVARRGSA